jgi:hypothetical protein
LTGSRAPSFWPGQEIVKLSGQKEAVLLEMMRERLKEARETAVRFVPKGKTSEPD